MRLVLEVAECCKAGIDHVASQSNNGGGRWPAQERERRHVRRVKSQGSLHPRLW